MHACIYVYFVFMCSCNGHVCIFVVQHIFATCVCVVMHRLWWFLIRRVSKCVLFTYFIQFEPHWLLHVTTGHIHHILFLLLHCHFKTVSQIYPREDFLSPLWGETGGIFDRSFKSMLKLDIYNSKSSNTSGPAARKTSGLFLSLSQN